MIRYYNQSLISNKHSKNDTSVAASCLYGRLYCQKGI